jgi:hypothetical protein
VTLSGSFNAFKQHPYLLSQVVCTMLDLFRILYSFFIFSFNVMRRSIRHTCRILTEPEPLCHGVQPVACEYYCTGYRVLYPLLLTAFRVSRDIPDKNKGLLNWHRHCIDKRRKRAVTGRPVRRGEFSMTTERRHPA